MKRAASRNAPNVAAGPLPVDFNVVKFPTGKARRELRTRNQHIRRRWLEIERSITMLKFVLSDQAGSAAFESDFETKFMMLDTGAEMLWKALVRTGYVKP